MRLDYPDYIRLLTAELNLLRENGELPTLLVEATPASIRSECEHVYEERYLRKDAHALKAFFGPADPGKQFSLLIRNFPTDKFKPLVNYLKGDTKKTVKKNIELLAWLIDFRHRPYAFGKEVQLNDQEIAILRDKKGISENDALGDEVEDDDLNEGKTIIDSDEITITENPPLDKNSPAEFPKKISNDLKARFPAIAMIIAIAAVVVSALVFLINREDPQEIQHLAASRESRCMYWVNDHYEELPCNQATAELLVIPFNEFIIKKFRKIPNDSITEQSIGKVYYLKTDNEVECFTLPGRHPVFLSRKLKRLTPGIYETYVKKHK